MGTTRENRRGPGDAGETRSAGRLPLSLASAGTERVTGPESGPASLPSVNPFLPAPAPINSSGLIFICLRAHTATRRLRRDVRQVK